jgi:putative transposase
MPQYTAHYRSHNNVLYFCRYHVIWCSKYRRAVLTGGVDTRLMAIIQDVCTESRAEIIALEVVPDYVYLMVDIDPQYGIHRLVRSMKGRSSRLLRQEYPWLRSRLPTLWTNSYLLSAGYPFPHEVFEQYMLEAKRH